MKNINPLSIIAHTISGIMYPLFIPTYGMILFYLGFTNQLFPMPLRYWLVLIGGTFFLTCLLPLSLILCMIKLGRIKDIHITDSKERTTPYIYCIVAFVFWVYFLYAVVHAPNFIILVAAGATLALGLVAIINLKWKISAHMTALGGLVGGVFSFCIYFGVLPMRLIMTLFCLSLIVMCCRIYLNAHTSMQIVVGYLMGLLCAFIPNVYLYHA